MMAAALASAIAAVAVGRIRIEAVPASAVPELELAG
jgi:hypothetical protein